MLVWPGKQCDKQHRRILLQYGATAAHYAAQLQVEAQACPASSDSDSEPSQRRRPGSPATVVPLALPVPYCGTVTVTVSASATGSHAGGASASAPATAVGVATASARGNWQCQCKCHWQGQMAVPVPFAVPLQLAHFGSGTLADSFTYSSTIVVHSKGSAKYRYVFFKVRVENALAPRWSPLNGGVPVTGYAYRGFRLASVF